MLGRGSDEFIYTKEETYKSLCNARFLYQMLSESEREKFLDALNKNPLRKIIEAESISISEIYNFYAFEEYFIFQKGGQEELLLIQKLDVAKITVNLKINLRNNWKTDRKFLLN